MRIERNDFARLLAATTKVVESRNTIPILSMVRMIAEDGRLTVTATDLDIVATASAEADGDISVCVDARTLETIVKKLPTGAEIDITEKDNTLVVKSGRSRFSLPTLPVHDFPDMAHGEMPTKFTTNLAALFAPVKFAISTEETRFYLNGIYLHTDGGKLSAVATDGHRLSRNLAGDAPEFKGVIVPRKLVDIIPLGDVDVELSDTKIRIAAPGVVLTSKLIDGTFPDYQRIVPTGNDRELVADREAFARAVDRVTVVSSERGHAVKLSIASDAVSLSVNNPDAGSATDELAATYSAEPMDIGFNAKYLLEILGQVKCSEVRVMLADSGSPTLFYDSAAPDLYFVCMPMRV